MARSMRTKRKNGKKSKSLKRISNSDITVDLPFPPKVKLENFFPSKYSVSLRTLNAFIIYRKVVTDEIKKSHTLCWSRISTIASKKWSLENDVVKQHYKDLAEKAKTLYRSKHLFYVHHGQNAAESVMFQDNNESTTSPKKFIFVSSEYENYSLNNSSNQVAGQQNASNEQIEWDKELSNDSNSHILMNENEQNIISSYNTSHNHELQHQNIIEFFDTPSFPMTAFLNDDDMVDSLFGLFSFPQDEQGFR